MKIVSDLRNNGISADMDFTGRSLKAQFKYADKISAKYALVIGENEIANKQYAVKRLADGKIFETNADGLSDSLKRLCL